jgi:hypothetical protein
MIAAVNNIMHSGHILPSWGTSAAVTDIRVRRKKAAVKMSTFTGTSMPTVPLTTVATQCRLRARQGQSLGAWLRQWPGNGARGQPTWPVVRLTWHKWPVDRVGLSKPSVTWQVDSPSHRNGKKLLGIPQPMATLQERRLGYHSRAGLEPGSSRFSTLRINHYAARGMLAAVVSAASMI